MRRRRSGNPLLLVGRLAMRFASLQSRAKAFGVISAMEGIGAAAGVLLGAITSAIRGVGRSASKPRLWRRSSCPADEWSIRWLHADCMVDGLVFRDPAHQRCRVEPALQARRGGLELARPASRGSPANDPAARHAASLLALRKFASRRGLLLDGNELERVDPAAAD
jgi:hypothetical protein